MLSSSKGLDIMVDFIGLHQRRVSGDYCGPAALASAPAIRMNASIGEAL
jgi:hypothetical protein